MTMKHKLVTCPETERREEIDFEETPFGIVVAACRRFQPGCALDCARGCAKTIDQQDRRNVDDRVERILVLYADDPETRSAAELLAVSLKSDGLIVDLAAADPRGAPPPSDYEAVVIGSPVRFGRYARTIIEYIARHHETLTAMPTFFFSLGRTPNASVDLVRLVGKTGWRPIRNAALARPSRLVRWFGDPDASKTPDASRIRELAIAISDEVPGMETLA